ncbi:MAG: DUF4129 domain-containing protein [Planctomycetaceae bacterium]|nr:DUF4129 domain-containing protein [Planctomycetales bacterium]MCB9872996.1 DUF4129 domain-containing protein [Planctomycetaceae bacterium]
MNDCVGQLLSNTYRPEEGAMRRVCARSEPRAQRARGQNNPRRQLNWAVCIATLVLFFASSTFAQELSDTQAVEAGREALDGAVNFPWYDSESDGIQRLNVEPPGDLKNRSSKWEKTIKAKKARTPWSMPDWLWTILEVLGWTLLVMALVAVGYFLVRAFLVAETGHATGEAFTEGAMGPGDIDRVESLPFQLKAPRSDLLSEARRHYEAGNYKDAIIYLYSYQLVELDKHQLIRLTKGKTNRQYLREVRRRSDLSALLSGTMYAFEDVFFGNHPLDRSRFEACWSGLDAFHRSLEQATA